MNVTVKYFAQLSELAGTRSETLELEDRATAQDLVRRLAAERGAAFRALVLGADGALAPTVLLFVGEEQVDWDRDRELHEGDRLLLATPIAGG